MRQYRVRGASAAIRVAVFFLLFLAAAPARGQRSSGPLAVSVTCDEGSVAVGRSVRVTAKVANRSSSLIQIEELNLTGAGFDEITPLARLIPRKLSPRTAYLASADARAVRGGQQRLTLRLRYMVIAARGGVHYADLYQTPLIQVGGVFSTGGGYESAVVLGAGVAVISVLLLEYLRQLVRRLGDRRRARSLLYVTVGLSLNAVRGDQPIPLEAWETLLLTDGYAGQIDSLARWRVKGAPFSRQLTELYPGFVQYNQSIRDRRGVDSEAQSDLAAALEKLRDTVGKL